MVNVIIAGDGTAFGVLEVDALQPRQFSADDIAFLRSYANLIAAAIDRLKAHKALARAADENKLLLDELRHRVKNTLTLASSLVSQTRTNARSAEEFREAVLGRLVALGRAEDLMFELQADHVELADLVERVLEPYKIDQPEAVSVLGCYLGIPVSKARMLGLVIHELATNGAKYSALSRAGGQVLVSWSIQRELSQVRLLWQECGGPMVEPPLSTGFGSRMIEQMCPHELGAEVELTFPARWRQMRD